MVVEGLTIPPLLDELLAAGRWPRDQTEAARNFVAKDRCRELRRIHLWPPPFRTYAAFAARGWDDFFKTNAAVHELVPQFAVEIADWGPGGDSPIVLDFQFDRTQPRVIHLRWSNGTDQGERYSNNYWEEFSPDFASFVELLGL